MVALPEDFDPTEDMQASDFGRYPVAFSGIARPYALPNQCVESPLEK